MQKRHLEFPDLCPQTLLENLNKCWQVEPKDRPSFHELVKALLDTKIELDPEMSGRRENSLNNDVVATESEENVPMFYRNKYATGNQYVKPSEIESIEQQNKSTNWRLKIKKHKSCAIFSMLFIVMVSAGAAYAFHPFYMNVVCRPGYFEFPSCQGKHGFFSNILS